MVSAVYDHVGTIRAEAARLDPVKVFITLFLLPFFVVGWTVRFVWVAFSLAWTGAMHGWRVASKQIDTRQQAATAGAG